jgi:hypothetical protein
MEFRTLAFLTLLPGVLFAGEIIFDDYRLKEVEAQYQQEERFGEATPDHHGWIYEFEGDRSGEAMEHMTKLKAQKQERPVRR